MMSLSVLSFPCWLRKVRGLLQCLHCLPLLNVMSLSSPFTPPKNSFEAHGTWKPATYLGVSAFHRYAGQPSGTEHLSAPPPRGQHRSAPQTAEA